MSVTRCGRYPNPETLTRQADEKQTNLNYLVKEQIKRRCRANKSNKAKLKKTLKQKVGSETHNDLTKLKGTAAKCSLRGETMSNIKEEKQGPGV